MALLQSRKVDPPKSIACFNGRKCEKSADTTINESFNELDCTDVGSLEVDLLLTDFSGNTTACETIVHVQDVTPPNANCQDVQVYLDEEGQGVFYPYLLDNQSTDACGIGALYTIPDLFELDCTDVGIIPVQLIVQIGRAHV